MVIILLLNVMEVLIMGGGALLDRQCMVFQRMCVFSRDIDLPVYSSIVLNSAL